MQKRNDSEKSLRKDEQNSTVVGNENKGLDGPIDRRRFLRTGAAFAAGGAAAYSGPAVAVASGASQLSPPEVIVIGMVYDQDDTVGPATILDLFIDYNADVIAPDDVITVYRGIAVANGQQLDNAINILDDVRAGDVVPMTIVPGGVGAPVDVFPVAKKETGGSKTTNYTNSECTGPGRCKDGTFDCTETKTWERNPTKPKKFRHRYNCIDTATPPNAFTGRWISGK